MKCNYCNEEIRNDVAHITEDGVYHLSCFRKNMHGPDVEQHSMFECPKCHTLGKVWSRKKDNWKQCRLCKGTGYILEKEYCVV